MILGQSWILLLMSLSLENSGKVEFFCTIHIFMNIKIGEAIIGYQEDFCLRTNI